MALSRRDALAGASLGLLAAHVRPASGGPMSVFNIRSFGAKGDGVMLDTAAIQKAIDAAAGGGTVFLPAGRYLSFSLHLRSRVTILFDAGAVLLAADPAKHRGQYDLPETNPFDQHQDFGHNYWHNSLMWGEGLENVTIAGPGLIDGSGGLTRESPTAPWSVGIGRDLPPDPKRDAVIADFRKQLAAMRGQGNKAIALKNCRNVIVRDVSILRAGHFGLLLSGVDNVTLDGLKIDTQRDGIDLDVVRNARVSNCTVNSPYDDGICLKASFALGVARPTENVSITNCQVTGYDVGSLLDGSYRKLQLHPLMNHRTSGRIKLGTETNGGFRNIAVSNCVFDCCNGLAIESVDGGVVEDVVVSNLVMRDTTAAPLFIRLADRRRAPKGTPIAQLRRISISNVDCLAVDQRLCSTITGVPGAIVEDVTLRGMRWTYQGGLSAEFGERPVPEKVEDYPDPDMFGAPPAWGLYARHVHGLVLDDIEMTALNTDGRKPVIFDDVQGLRARDVFARNGKGETQSLTF